MAGVLFAIYSQESGGGALWQDVLNVPLGKSGEFDVAVGTMKSIPADLFAGEEPRWLGMLIQQAGEVEQRRLRLVTTAQGLKVERATRLVIPAQASGETAAGATATAPSEEAHSPTPDQKGAPSRSPRTGRGLLRRSTRSTSGAQDPSGAPGDVQDNPIVR